MPFARPPCLNVRIHRQENAVLVANALLLHSSVICFRIAQQWSALNFLQVGMTHTGMAPHPSTAWNAIVAKVAARYVIESYSNRGARASTSSPIANGVVCRQQVLRNSTTCASRPMAMTSSAWSSSINKCHKWTPAMWLRVSKSQSRRGGSLGCRPGGPLTCCRPESWLGKYLALFSACNSVGAPTSPIRSSRDCLLHALQRWPITLAGAHPAFNNLAAGCPDRGWSSAIMASTL